MSNSLLTWDNAAFGCVERDTFRLDPGARTVMSSLGAGRFYSARGDLRAPLTAHFQTWQTFPQSRALWQWYHNDLYGGALPFRIELWLWNNLRFVRARFVGQFTTRLDEQYSLRLTAGTFEIERESTRPPAAWVEIPQEKTATCLPSRASFMTKRGIQKTTCTPERAAFLIPPGLQKAATCVPAKSDLLK